MSDIFSKIANEFKKDQRGDLASKVASKKIALTQPLQMRRDYGSREAVDFLADSTVQVNSGYDQGLDLVGPGNAQDYVDYLDLDDDYEGEGSYEGGQGYVDDLGIFSMMIPRYARFHSGPKGQEEFKKWKEEHPEAAEEFDRQTEINKDVVKNRAKAMQSEDYEENEDELEELEAKVKALEEEQEEILDKASKKARSSRRAYYGPIFDLEELEADLPEDERFQGDLSDLIVDDLGDADVAEFDLEDDEPLFMTDSERKLHDETFYEEYEPDYPYEMEYDADMGIDPLEDIFEEEDEDEDDFEDRIFDSSPLEELEEETFGFDPDYDFEDDLY